MLCCIAVQHSLVLSFPALPDVLLCEYVQVNELTMQNEYQLRLKDLAMNEKVKELTEKFTAELDVDKTKFDSLLQEKNEQELEYEEKMKQVEEKHQVWVCLDFGHAGLANPAKLTYRQYVPYHTCLRRLLPTLS